MKRIYGKLLKFHKDQKGSTLLVTMVAMLFIGTLGTLILIAALANYEMNNMDYGSKRSFYLAEKAMEEIHSGIGVDAMGKLSDAYVEVLGNIVKNDGSGGFFKIDNTKANEQFREKYFDMLEAAYCNANVNAVMDTVKAYVRKENGYNYTIEDPVSIQTVKKMEDGKEKIDSVVIEGLKVICENQRVGYYSSITTDIIIQAPPYEINFTTNGTVPWDKVMQYCVVARNDLNIASDSKIIGNLFSGNDGIAFVDRIGTKKINVDVLAHNVVTSGSITEAYADVDIKSDDSSKAQIWAKSLKTSSYVQTTGKELGKYSKTISDYQSPHILNKYNIDGRCILADDLEVSGDGSEVTIKGEYYGYGDSTITADNNSAIVVNGLGASLDMTSVNKLLVAGNAYVDLTQGGGLQDYSTGESITVKGNQVAYLADLEDLKDISSSLTNPMEVSEFKDAYNAGLDSKKIIKRQVGSLYYFYKKDGSLNHQISIYNDYFSNNCTDLFNNPLMSRISKMKLSKLQIDTGADIYTKANILQTDGSSISKMSSGEYNSGGSVGNHLIELKGDLKHRYAQMCTLLDDYRGAQEIGSHYYPYTGGTIGNAYESCVEISRVEALASGVEYSGTMNINGKNTYYMVCNNKDVSTVTIPNGYDGYVVICSGSVSMPTDMNGIVFAKEVLVRNDAGSRIKVSADAALVKAILDNENTIPNGLSKRIAWFLVGLVTDDKDDGKNINNVGYDDIVGYENWAKNQ